jgi:nuclear pore complex protein Nup155
MATATPFARQVPGGFVNTPQTIRPSLLNQRPPSFRLPLNPTLQNAAQATSQPEAAQPAPVSKTTSPMQRAENGINQVLAIEKKFPVLDDYVYSELDRLARFATDLIGGTSGDYDMPDDSSWLPFERAKNFDIPDRIFEQLNVATASTRLGLFAQLHHAWVAIDDSLYIWDYTHPNPELVGFDELREAIQVVHLAKPKPDVFLSNVTHVLLIATMSEVVILGLGATKSPEGVTSVSLYQTGLRVPLKGLTPVCFASSAVTGRIFMGFSDVNDVYEITYQKEERWFFSKCGKINHTSPYILNAVAATTGIHKLPIMGPPSTPEFTTMMEVDDSREMLYVLSSRSTIRVYRMKSPSSLILVVNKSWNDTLRNLAHVVPVSNALSPRLKISSISPISLMQSNRIHLVATSVGGVRMYFTIVSSGAYLSEEATSSMQIHHVRLPPVVAPTTSSAAAPNALASDYLLQTTRAKRYPPGFHFFVVSGSGPGPNDRLFVSCPDSGRLARYTESGGTIKFLETAQWVQMNGTIQDIEPTQPEFFATKVPAGFGNEMAVQFDQSPTEIAVLTNQGVHLYRRQRMVDVFASSLKLLLTDEDFENCIKKFIRIFGRIETCACAVAVACGHSVVADTEVKNYARRAFTEHGGKPDISEVLDAGQSQQDSVRPSPRAQALTLYVSRIIRSAWTAKVITTTQIPGGGIKTKTTVSIGKLNDISRSLMNLKSFLLANKTYIAGLSGPEEMNRVTSVAEQVALQGEHRILDALFKAISNTIEGIAFLAELFDQPVDEIMLSLQDQVRERFKSLTYADLFLSDDGKIVAKEVIKAIVNRSIAAGSNVETVADSLRRRCGSFCSADDVVIFKAQELLQKAINAGAETATGRSFLNESLRLFQEVTGSLSNQYLESAVVQYVNMQFFAGTLAVSNVSI